MEQEPTRVWLLHKPDPQHLEEVKAEMHKLGSPTIRAIENGNGIWAIEGTHRLCAAEALGVEVNLVVLYDDDEITMDSIDNENMQSEFCGRETVPVSEYAERFFDQFNMNPQSAYVQLSN